MGFNDFLIRVYLPLDANTAFPTEFSDGDFDEACAYRHSCLRGSVVKHMGYILEIKEKGQS
jgi:hypothetical protein